MADDKIITDFAYDRMVEHALRSVVREVLTVTERQGLPGQHHFYVTFRTDHPGVLISSRLKATHPQTMTVVLQNQFWDLTVYDEAFGVTLSFSGRREHLTIPFDSVTAFADPHASFGLQFHVMLPDGLVADDPDDDEDDAALSPRERDLKDEAIKGALKVLAGDADESDPERSKRRKGAATPTEGDDGDGDDDPGGNVITLDRFRKKH